jgi:hypothetical protein
VAELKAGTIVHVRGAAGEVFGEIVDRVSPAELPAIATAPDVHQVRAILREFRVTEIAFIRHMYGDQLVMFAALHCAAGQWRDLKGHELTIEAVAIEEAGSTPDERTSATPRTQRNGKKPSTPRRHCWPSTQHGYTGCSRAGLPSPLFDAGRFSRTARAADTRLTRWRSSASRPLWPPRPRRSRASRPR